MNVTLPAGIVQDMQTANLPVPDSIAVGHCENLCHRIREVITGNNGNISFARYLDMALYEPGMGH